MNRLFLYLGLMWGIFFLNLSLGNQLMMFALRGGWCFEFQCLAGIFFHPFLHANLAHIFGNSLMYIPLGLLIVYQDKSDVDKVFWLSTIIPGLASMALQSPGTTGIGSSGVTFGMFGFLVSLCVFQMNLMNLALLIWSILLAGNTIWGMFPNLVPPGVSWFGHLTGFSAGIVCAYLKANKQLFWR